MSDYKYTGENTLSALSTLIKTELDKKLEKVSTMDTASASNVGTQVIYIGTTTSSYTKGGIYECQLDSSTSTYSWVMISGGGSGHTIEDDTTVFAQRSSLKFENCTVTDDATNDATIVTPIGIAVDSAISSTSENPVQNKVIKTALDAKQDSLTFDSTPTSSSTNPVTSGGIYSALSGKQATLTFDSAPTSGSTNPVTSGGMYSALTNLDTAKQPKTLVTPLTIGGTQQTTVEGALGGLNSAISSAGGALYFTGQACSATTGDFCTISNSAITADHVVAECIFANPSYITSDLTYSHD